VYRSGAEGAQLEGDATEFTLERRVRLATTGTSGRLLSSSEPLYAERFKAHFDGMTPEFELKMVGLQPRQGEFTFDAADRLVDGTLALGKGVRGHTLVWHRSLPTWVTGRGWSRDALADVLVTHIRTVAAHYRGRISDWDVVNEALNDDGTWRETIWYQVLGEDYVELAFRTAHEAAPEALLYLNDYNAEQINAKSTALLALVKRLRAKGVPIHGMGFQAHVSINYNPTREQLRDNLARFEAAGLLTQVTELDVRTANAPGLSVQQRLDRQAEIYGAATLACLDSPGCVRVTTWGISDKFATDGATELPLLFDAQYAPKPALSAVKAALGR
jgi:endo-1,4-beta-xylanase